MRPFYVPLSAEACNALCNLAAREYRHPKHQAALIIMRELSARGLLVNESHLDPGGPDEQKRRNP